MPDLLHKKVLLIAPAFFGYENEIIHTLESYGAEITYVQENIDSYGFIQKAVNKFPANIQQGIRTKHFIDIFRKLDLDIFDYVFCIRIDLFNDEILSFLKSKCKKAQFILYYWDSVRNMRNAVAKSAYFDSVYTFDLNDYEENRHRGWRFRPLFYLDRFSMDESVVTEKDLDIVFISSLSPLRAKMYLFLKDICKKHSLDMFVYFYVNPYEFLANKHKVSEYRRIDKSLIYGKGMPIDSVISYFRRAHIVIDCPSPTQTGLTMRTIECFGANKKMVTTNETIERYDFYNRNDHLLLRDFDEQALVDFIKSSEFVLPEKDLYNKYSLKGWIETLFDENNDDRFTV